MTSQNSYKIYVGDRRVTLTYIGKQNQPNFSEVTSVIVICFNDKNEILAVNIRKRGWDLPGGHVEDGEKDPIETLNREVMEEAYVTVRNPLLTEIIESDYYEDQKSYMLIYSARVDEVRVFKATDEVGERGFFGIEEFISKYQAGDKKLLRQAILKARDLLG